VRSFARVVLIALLAVAAGATIASRAVAAPLRPLQTALIAPPQASVGALDESDLNVAYDRVVAAGAAAARIGISWEQTAPKPPSDATDPDDPVYNWKPFDRLLVIAVAHGLTPIAAADNAPAWAAEPSASDSRARNYKPSIAAFRDFMQAAARRYDGRTPGVPRVRYWQIWVEPNVERFFAPQLESGKIVGAARYRALVNAATSVIHAARSDNYVIAGGLSPFTHTSGDLIVVGPLRWMRALLCMSAGANPHATCHSPMHFDIWAHHPYTSGGPTHHAYNPDDVSLGDLPKMTALLAAARRAGNVVSRGGSPRFWVTEFSWDSSPPDPKAVPIRLHARWVAEGLYRMWQNGVSLVAWLQLRDDPYPADSLQSGLYYRGASGIRSDRPKLSLRAFRFPFVAFSGNGGVTFWGRTPRSDARAVRIEERHGSTWRTRVVVRSNRFGIFAGRFSTSDTRGSVRARVPGDFSVPFSLVVPPDRFFNAFG
jgi:hypothetical protein